MLSSCYYFYYPGLVLQKGSLLSYCLCLHGDTEVHNGKRITLGTQRKLGFEPGSAQLQSSRQPADVGGMRAQPQGSPLVDWGVSRRQ